MQNNKHQRANSTLAKKSRMNQNMLPPGIKLTKDNKIQGKASKKFATRENSLADIYAT